MIPYHYSVVQCRLARARRNVGLLVISPTAKRAWLRRGPLHTRAHLLGDEAAFVRSLLDAIEDAAAEVAREGARRRSPSQQQQWI